MNHNHQREGVVGVNRWWNVRDVVIQFQILEAAATVYLTLSVDHVALHGVGINGG